MEEYISISLLGSLIPVFAAIAGSAVTGAFVVLSQRVNGKNEMEKVRTQLVIQAGVESWKTVIALHRDEPQKMLPMDSYILHMYKFSNVLFDPTTNAENIQSRLQEVHDFNTEAIKHWEKKTKATDKEGQN